MKRWMNAGLAGTIVGLGLLGAASCRSGDDGAESTPNVFATNGARIYYTSKSASGSPILASTSFGDAPAMPSRSCADCHGADGRGMVIEADSGYVQTPAINFARLASPDAYAGGRSYDESTLALTLRTGVRVDGYLLSGLMPRWSLTAEDMKDLVDHLKTLDAAGQAVSR